MKVYRVELNGWTASFRHPQLVSGTQPTLPLPPPSTIYGLLSSAVGEWINPKNHRIGYVFQFKGRARDLETIYQFSNSAYAKSNVLWREWLTDWKLWLYLPDEKLAEAFEKPVHPLLLGRQQELAYARNFSEITLQSTETRLQGTVVPFPFPGAAGMILALPLVMSQDTPRRPLGIRIWILAHRPSRLRAEGLYHDPQLNHGIFFIGGE